MSISRGESCAMNGLRGGVSEVALQGEKEESGSILRFLKAT